MPPMISWMLRGIAAKPKFQISLARIRLLYCKKLMSDVLMTMVPLSRAA
jgi:hypothetical protein